MAADGRLVWLYAVTEADAKPPAEDLTGVAGEAVRPVRAAGLTAVVSDVAAPEFGAAALRRNLEDLQWLEKTAREHHAVIDAVAGHGTVLPMRLATVYESDQGLAETLESRAGDLHRALSRVRGCHEWGVRGFVVEPAADAAGSEPGGDPGAGPGAAYLRRRRTQLNARENLRHEAASLAQTIYADLSRLSEGVRLYPPQSPELSGQSASMVLNAAYLIADGRTEEFTERAVVLADSCRSVLQITLTGPWPAYSFVGGPDAAGPDPGDVP